MTYLSAALTADGYKLGHADQYPDNTSLVASNFTPRFTYRVNADDSKPTHITWVGGSVLVNHYLTRFWKETFFDLTWDDAYSKLVRRIDRYLGPQSEAYYARYAELHRLGYLPIEVWALPEGSQVPYGVPPIQIISTQEFGWITNYIETLVSSVLWPMCTSATTARIYYELIAEGLETTYPEARGLEEWLGHDFSLRGTMGPEAGALSGLGHALYFKGTDTLPALDLIEECYPAIDPLVGGSVPATEHSVMCAGGLVDELSTFRRLITQVYPSGIVSIVSDTWDLWRVLTEYALELKSEILIRNGKVVFRPDSGDPVKILLGDPDAVVGSPAYKGCVELLDEVFGSTKSSTGFKVLNPKVGLIYGDSITPARARAIHAGLIAKGYATTNVVLGIGSYTYQYVTRDTDGWAMKATMAVVDGVERALKKSPITDDGRKHSASGLLAVFKDDSGEFYLKQHATRTELEQCAYQLIYRNDDHLPQESWDDIRARARCI